MGHEELLSILNRLVHIDSRLRLRSPATRAEIKVWAKIRQDSRTAVAKAKEEGAPPHTYDGYG